MLFCDVASASRRETELDERLDVLRQQIVVELVDLRPVISQLSVLDSHRPQHVVKDRVESDVAKAELVRDELELRLAVSANQRARKIGADRQIEEAVDGPGRRTDIHDNVTGRYLQRAC